MRKTKIAIMLVASLAGGAAVAGTAAPQISNGKIIATFKVAKTEYADFSCTITGNPNFVFGNVKKGEKKKIDSKIEVTCDKTGVDLNLGFDTKSGAWMTLQPLNATGHFIDADIEKSMYGFEFDIYQKDIDSMNGKALSVGGTAAQLGSSSSGNLYWVDNTTGGLTNIKFKNKTKTIEIPVHGTLTINNLIFKDDLTKTIEIPITLSADAIPL